MSTVIGVKLDDTVVLATDSRAMNGITGSVFSDAQPKIFEIMPGVFYGYAGIHCIGPLQLQVAAAIRPQSTRDLPTFADELDKISRPQLERLMDSPQMRQFSPCENEPFLAYVLAGVSEGCPGFLAREFRFIGGQIRRKEIVCAFRLPHGANFSLYAVGGAYLNNLMLLPQTWARGAVAGAERLVEHLRNSHPFVGGATQLVRIDKSGSRWIHRMEN